MDHIYSSTLPCYVWQKNIARILIKCGDLVCREKQHHKLRHQMNWEDLADLHLPEDVGDLIWLQIAIFQNQGKRGDNADFHV